MSFEEHLRALVFFHLEEHTSAQHLLQTLKEDDFAREHIAPQQGIEKSSFSEATNTRGLEQFMHVFQQLQAQASEVLPFGHEELGELVGIDGSLIDGTLSMLWADYRKGSKKAKVHVGFDLNRSIPRKVYLTDGNGAERPFVSKILSEGQTGVMDRGYQCHQLFDQWQHDDRLFICRIKASTKKKIISQNAVPADSIVFFDAMVLLGTCGVNQSQTPLRLVGYEIEGVKYWIATNRYDLSAEQISQAYKLRWNIENFFAWWKRHLKVYHLIARSSYGLMVQILSGLITYLLLALYCHSNYQEKVSIRRVRQLRTQIENELRCWPMGAKRQEYGKEQK
jgi:IS4 transposase